MTIPRRDPRKRFAEKVAVDPASGCWNWLAKLNHEGYALFWSGEQKTASGHRWAWSQRFGEIPAGMQIDHLCRNRKCVNPSHLEVVTPQENVLRGDTLPAASAAKSHCDSGHEFTEANTYIHPQRGSRNCRTCRAEATRRYQQKKVS